MRKVFYSIFMFFISILVPTFLTTNSDLSYSADEAKLSAGVAKVNITPKEKIPIGWHSGENIPYEGIHDEVFSRVIVFSYDKNKAAIISVDLSGFSHSSWEELTKRIEKETGIAREYIMLCATHTHSGPTHNLASYGMNTTPEVTAYTENLKDNIIQSVKDAVSNLGPVSIGAGKGECKMNMNRRARLAIGGLWLGKNPDGPCDHEVHILRMDDMNGNIKSIFVNWPCHGTVMGPENNYLTGDWLSATALFVEKEYGNKIIVPVTAGASGDIDPVIGPHGTTFSDQRINSDIYGILVGEEAIKVAKDAIMSSLGTIKASQRVITLPGKLSHRQMKDVPFREIQKLKPGTFISVPDVEIRLSAIRIGNIVFAGISAEAFNEIGTQIKKLSPYANTFIVTHCNGSSGYVPTDKAYYELSYEVAASTIMSGGEKAIIENLLDMINQLQ